LKVIVTFEVGSGHDYGWEVTNSKITYNTIKGDATGRMLPLAPDTNGIDKSFSSYIDVIFRAIRDADVKNHNLDYIHIGHDEMVCGGNSQYFIAASSDLDRNWLNARVKSLKIGYEQAYYDLIADEVSRRVTAVVTASRKYGQSTKVIMYADMFDPQGNGNPSGNSNGGTNFRAWAKNASGRDTLINLSTMNVLSCQAMANVRNNLVLNPWQYSRTYGDTYDAASSITYFRDKGFHVIPGSAYTSDIDDSREAMKEWIRVSALPENANTVIGQAAFNWYIGPYWRNHPRPALFKILPEMTTTVNALRH
jgi:hypothetical protein